MPDDELSRRLFLKATGTLAGSSLVSFGTPVILAISEAACTARDEGAAFKVLSDSEAIELETIASRILPTTDTPGAREAGVIYFMDNALGSFMQAELESIRSGLGEFQSSISASYSGVQAFSELSDADQDRHLRTWEHTAFFDLVRFMTIAGFFGMSSYGGNRDEVGWKLLGFDGHRSVWAPPFGYYDAEYMRGEQNGE